MTQQNQTPLKTVLYRVETVFNTNDGNTNTYIDVPVNGFFFDKKEELDALLEQHG